MILGVLDDLLERPTGQKIALLAGAILVIVALDWQYFYGARAAQLSKLQQELSERRAELEVKKGRADARADVERELRDLSAELKRAEARLPDQREIADLLSSIAGNARKSGLDITLFRQKPEVYRDFYAEVPVQMEMRGTYHDLVAFLDRVKRLDRIVNVANIQLKKPRVDGDRVLIDASCTATTFRFLDEAERRRVAEEAKKGEKGKARAGGKGA